MLQLRDAFVFGMHFQSRRFQTHFTCFWLAAQQVSIAAFLASLLARQLPNQCALLLLLQALQRVLHLGQIGKFVQPTAAPFDLAHRLWTAQQQHA